MAFQDLATTAQIYFPNLKIAYKDQSTFMKVLGKILFFAPAFTNNFATTIGSTIYFPTEAWAQSAGGLEVFIHETIHMWDKKRLSFLYTLGYCFPQLLALPSLLLFLISWKLAIPVSLFFLIPLPAPFRAYFEYRAYAVQFYTQKRMFDGSQGALDSSAEIYNGFFTGSSYYWMWVFGLLSSLKATALNVFAGNDPINDNGLMQMVDSLITAAKK